jgi:hypothetical protein
MIEGLKTRIRIMSRSLGLALGVLVVVDHCIVLLYQQYQMSEY